MGLALPLRRCAGLSVLGLEVFRSLTSGRWSEDPLPAPSLSSGATTEYDHSRQSIDPRVRRPRRPTLSGWPFERGAPLPASNRVHHRCTADGRPDHEWPGFDTAPFRFRRGRPPKRLHRPRTRRLEVSARTRRSSPDRPELSLPTEAGRHRYRAPSGRDGKPSATR